MILAWDPCFGGIDIGLWFLFGTGICLEVWVADFFGFGLVGSVAGGNGCLMGSAGGDHPKGNRPWCGW
jgi:hypothetical protein